MDRYNDLDFPPVFNISSPTTAANPSAIYMDNVAPFVSASLLDTPVPLETASMGDHRAGGNGERDMASLVGISQFAVPEGATGGAHNKEDDMMSFHEPRGTTGDHTEPLTEFFARQSNAKKEEAAPRRPAQTSGANMDSNVLMTQALSSIVNQLARMQVQQCNHQPRAPCRARFGGTDLEHPKVFLIEMKRYFAQNKIDDPLEQTFQALDRLQGRAASWGASFKVFPISFQEFQRRFLDAFDDTDTQVRLRAQFYGTHQTTSESSEEFITKKRAISARINPHDQLPEVTVISTIITLMTPELRSRLRFSGIDNFEELISSAKVLEEDLREIQRFTRPQQRSPAPGFANRAILPPRNPQPHRETSQGPRRPERRPENAPDARQQPRGNREGCFNCGGPHWARDCRQQRAIMPAPHVNATEASRRPVAAPRRRQHSENTQQPSSRPQPKNGSAAGAQTRPSAAQQQ